MQREDTTHRLSMTAFSLDAIARSRRALRARYGDKPVIYPPPPKTAFELKP